VSYPRQPAVEAGAARGELRVEPRRTARATTTGVLIAAAGGSYVPALVVSGGFALLGAFAYLVIVGRIEPLPVLSQKSTRPAQRDSTPGRVSS
jgi:hypothetical protein